MADFVLLGVLLLSVLLGLFRGLIREVVSLAAWVVAALVAWLGSEPAGAWLLPWTGSPQLARVLAAAALFLGVLLLGGLVTGVLRGLITAVGLGTVDRLLGLLFGALRGLLVLLVAVTLLEPVAAGAGWWRSSDVVPLLLELREEWFRIGPLAAITGPGTGNGGWIPCAA